MAEEKKVQTSVECVREWVLIIPERAYKFINYPLLQLL